MKVTLQNLVNQIVMMCYRNVQRLTPKNEEEVNKLVWTTQTSWEIEISIINMIGSVLL